MPADRSGGQEPPPPPVPPPPSGNPAVPFGGWGVQPLGAPSPQLLPPRRRMRRSWIVGGIVAGVLGVLTLIGGAVALVVSSTASSLDPVAEARTPGTATFDADETTYDVLLVRRRTDSARSAASVECEVTLADGRTIRLDGSRQATSIKAANTESIGSFDAVEGETSVFCEAEGGDNRFVVDEEGTLDRLGKWLLYLGIGVLLAGIALVLGGIFLRRPAPAA